MGDRRRDLTHFEQSPRQVEIHLSNVYMMNKMRNHNLHMHLLTPPWWRSIFMVYESDPVLIWFYMGTAYEHFSIEILLR